MTSELMPWHRLSIQGRDEPDDSTIHFHCSTLFLSKQETRNAGLAWSPFCKYEHCVKNYKCFSRDYLVIKFDDMFALVYWPDGKTISIVSKSDIKCKNPAEGSEYPVKWGKRSFVGRILKFGDKAQLEILTVDPEGQIISGQAVTTAVASSRQLLNEEKRNQQMQVTETVSSLNKQLINMPHVQNKAHGNQESETKDPDNPNDGADPDDPNDGADPVTKHAVPAAVATPAVQESTQTLARIFEPVFALVNESNLKFVSTLAQALSDGVEYIKRRPNAEFGETSSRDDTVLTASEPRCRVRYPCDDKHGKGMRELVPGSQIYINKYRKTVIVTRAGTNSRVLLRELFKELVGENILKTCSAKGLRDKLAVRKDVYDAVEAFVREWTSQVKEEKPNETVEELNARKFAHVFNTYVSRLRSTGKGKEERAKAKTSKQKTSEKKNSPLKADGQGSGVKTRSSARKEASATKTSQAIDEGKLESATRTLVFSEDPHPSCSNAPAVYPPQYQTPYQPPYEPSFYQPPYNQAAYNQASYNQAAYQAYPSQSQYQHQPSTHPVPGPDFLSL